MYYDTSNSTNLHFSQFGHVILVMCKYSILKNKRKMICYSVKFVFPSQFCEIFQKTRKITQIHNRKKNISQHFC